VQIEWGREYKGIHGSRCKDAREKEKVEGP
jgi:hypothetical protein